MALGCGTIRIPEIIISVRGFLSLTAKIRSSHFNRGVATPEVFDTAFGVCTTLVHSCGCMLLSMNLPEKCVTLVILSCGFMPVDCLIVSVIYYIRQQCFYSKSRGNSI